MKRRLIILFTLFYIILPAFGQEILCDSIKFQLVPIPESDTSAVDFKYRLRVEMNLLVSDLKSDTISLRTNIKIAQGLGPENLIAEIRQNNRSIPLESWVDNQVDPQPFHDTQFLNIVLPDNQETNLVVSYDVIGTGFFFYIPALNYPSVFTYHCDDEYFYPMDIPINKMEVTAPDSIHIFYSHKKGLDKKEKINLTFINKKYFESESFKVNDIHINLFTPDTLVNDSSLIIRKREFQTHLSRLNSWVTTEKTIDIIWITWRNEEKRNAFARVFGDHYLIDYKMSSNSLLHETLHIVLPCEVEPFSKGEYFINECIIEWLSLYLSAHPYSIDIPLEVENQTLYDTHINDHTTWHIIYKIGPVILQKIANSGLGEEQLAKLIIGFIEQQAGKITTYMDFIDYLKDHISGDLVEYLDSMVKGKYKY